MEINKENIQKAIDDFLDKKKISHPFLRECVTEFVEGHNKLFGEYVSTEDLFKRLDDNLDKITFAGNSSYILGQYEKKNENFDNINEITIYKKESELEIPEDVMKSFGILTNEAKQEYIQERETRRNNIKSTVIHELTHAAYTKNDDLGMGDEFYHVFSTTSKDMFGLNKKDKRMLSGKNYYIEGIINYISTKIKPNNSLDAEAYKFETKAINMLAEKLGDEAIIKSAWNSDEQILKNAYISSLGKTSKEGIESYIEFDKDMRRLNLMANKTEDLKKYFSNNNKIINHMESLLEGKTISLQNEKINNNIKSNEISELPLEWSGHKNGLEDIENSNVNKLWLNRATNYVKNKYRELKDKVIGQEKQSKEEGNER